MIDTHCHIDDPQYTEDFDSFILQQQEAGVSAIVVPGVNTDSLLSVPKVCLRYPDYLFPAIGIHPEEIREDFVEQLEKIHNALFQRSTISFSPHSELQNPHSELVSESLNVHSKMLKQVQDEDCVQNEDCVQDKDAYRTTNWIAVGEIGLDYHFDTTFKKEQQEAFHLQLQWAIQKNLPVLIHSRDATEDCINILQEYTKKGLRGIMHCFSGSRETAEIYVKMGLLLGIGGVITFKNSKLAENLKTIPLENIVLETDAPYMAPVPFRGKRNESRWMRYVMERLAEVYGCTTEDIDKQTTRNAKLLFGI